MVLSLDDLEGPECEWCGSSLEEKRPDARHCSRKCTTAHKIEIKRLERIEAKAKRSPCPVCNEVINAETNGNRVYCSSRCRGKANYEKRKHRQPHTKECEYCRTWFNAFYKHQRFCSLWCKSVKEPSGFAKPSPRRTAQRAAFTCDRAA